MTLAWKPAERIIIDGLFVLSMTQLAWAQQVSVRPSMTPTAVAFVNVSVIPMDRERVVEGQTVLVRGDRIVAMGPTRDVPVPHDATIIDGTGRYLVPGLTDAHVHLDPVVGARPVFGDAPIYLAYGITTVINLRGDSSQLEWRRRAQAGELLAPNIYTAGEFVNEPRVNTPEEVRHEILAQQQQGYDLIKFHQVLKPAGLGYATTHGLELPAYVTMMEVARQARMPLIGHAPTNLGLEALLSAHQSLSHVGELNGLYFLPVSSVPSALLVTGTAVSILLLMIAGWIVTALAHRLRRHGLRPAAPLRVRALAGWVLVSTLLLFVCFVLLMPIGLLFDNPLLRPLFTLLALVVAALTIALLIEATGVWRRPGTPGLARLQTGVVSAACLALALVATIYWTPIAWRSSEFGIQRVARNCRDAGIWVQTTLVVYENLVGRRGPESDIDYLQPRVQGAWRRLPPALPPVLAKLVARYPDFTRKVTAALHQQGVRLMAGTDSMGVPFLVPGRSLHRELQILAESGLTPYETLRAATTAPAKFLGKENEFGTIATGNRADLLLVEENALQNISTLKAPVGVMVRGVWLTREQLQRMLRALVTKG